MGLEDKLTFSINGSAVLYCEVVTFSVPISVSIVSVIEVDVAKRASEGAGVFALDRLSLE